MQKKILGFGLSGSGVLSIIFGIITLAQKVDFYGTTSSFGADFYTYVHNKIVAVGNTIERAAGASKMGTGFLLIIIGLIALVVGVSFILVKNTEAPVVEPSVTQQNIINRASEAAGSEKSQSEGTAVDDLKTDGDVTME